MTDGLHIVVVDDDPAIVTLLSTSLRVGLGARVTAFSSGEEALAGWDALGPVSLVMTDYSMPGLTGVELALLVRSRAPTVPIVMLSAVEHTGSAGGAVTQWFTKPCPPRQLLPELRRLLGLPAAPLGPLPSAPSGGPRASSPGLAELRRRYREQLKAVLERLDSLLAGADSEAGERALRDELHQLAGTAGSYGFRGITEASLSLRGAIIGRGPRDEAVGALRRAIEEALEHGWA